MVNSFYKPGMSPKDLASIVLKDSFGDADPLIPIDPFRLLRKYGIVYQFMDFKDLEGLYLVPTDEEDIAVVGINKNRPITRQRFTHLGMEMDVVHEPY